jgi:Zn-dependent peptidase ImmA (M78 family)
LTKNPIERRKTMEEKETKKVEGTPKKKYVPKRLSKKEMDTITGEIDLKLHDFITSGKYKEVLIAMGNLGKYSLNNQIYILIQKPEASTVHGMKKWNTMGRHVMPGEKSIRIFSPILKNVEKELKDENGNPVLDKDGNSKKVKAQIPVAFEQGYVFDVTQTDGPEITAFKFDESKIVENKDKILKGLSEVVKEKGFTISYATKEELGEGCYGLCNKQTKEIKILEGMSDLQEVSTTVHECGHALAHSEYRKDFEGLSPLEKREIKEVEAESIACVVCTYLGLDTQNFNFSYISGWADGDISKFKENLNVISKHSKRLIGGIEREIYKDVVKEDKTLGEAKLKESPDPPAMTLPTQTGEQKQRGMEMA